MSPVEKIGGIKEQGIQCVMQNAESHPRGLLLALLPAPLPLNRVLGLPPDALRDTQRAAVGHVAHRLSRDSLPRRPAERLAGREDAPHPTFLRGKQAQGRTGACFFPAQQATNGGRAVSPLNRLLSELGFWMQRHHRLSTRQRTIRIRSRTNHQAKSEVRQKSCPQVQKQPQRTQTG